MNYQFPQIPNYLIANHSFAFHLLEHATLSMCNFTNFDDLFFLTNFDHFEGDVEDYFVAFLSNENQ